ncbi:DUF4136 domain-containing protein [Larkinella harenae]
MKSILKILLWLGVGVGFGSGISSCRPDPLDNLSPEESQVFITNRDRSANFATYKTFSLPDSVIEVSNDQARVSLTGLETPFLNRLAQELTSRGYTRVNRRDSTDLGVAVMRINNSYIGVNSMPFSPYYLDYWGFGGLGGWGGFNPYFPNYYSFYEVSESYWMIQLIDLKNPNTADQELNVIWQAQIRGNGIFDANSIDAMLTKVFEQSSYLRANQ